ncbi:uncharacterized protein SCODWIG_01361 [Saccharomycodes ludwigii]|uniref:Nucleolar 27S pre-rRNA processing Urb2/Npa2 C-terminal domain-containing protein n=1 Tax=Saccharomycodes ludwigii TaxID=36035 RepID=A0A376B672_9ASCO|nr:uncharacterized protein SCODWIG_01361 [Saccharomycodes ludwigii]
MNEDLPKTSQGISRLLRSKTIEIDELVSIINSNVFQNEIYFPNKYLFVLELIIDRWNDDKNSAFKKTPMIWESFNKFWLYAFYSKGNINTNNKMVKLFNKLKIFNIFTNFFSLIENNKDDHDYNDNDNTPLLAAVDDFLSTMLKSSITFDMTPDQCFKLLTQAIVSLNTPNNTNLSILPKLLILMDFNSKAEQNRFAIYLSKNFYVFNEYLLYIERHTKGDNITDNLIYNMLCDFVFNSEFSHKLIENLLNDNNKINGIAITQNTTSIFFRLIIEQQPKFTQPVFSKITSVYPNVATKFLKTLIGFTRKKLLSQDLLNNLFQQNINRITECWDLIDLLLQLDIEVGISNTMKIFEVLEKNGSGVNESNGITIWKRLIQCHVNAREFNLFILDKWIVYLEKERNFESIFFTSTHYTSIIESEVKTLSASQLSDILEKVSNAASFDVRYSNKLLTFIIRGLNNPISGDIIMKTPQLSSKLHMLIGSQYTGSNNDIELTYYLLEVYYSNFDAVNDLNFLNKLFDKIISSGKHNEIYFYTLFKLQELFEIENFNKLVIVPFTSYIKHRKNTFQSFEQLFTRWSSLINSMFNKSQLNDLIAILVNDYPDILLNIASNAQIKDDFFEENEIIYNIITQSTQKIVTDNNINNITKYIEFISMVPLECIYKNTRVELINFMTSKFVQSNNNDNTLLKNTICYLLHKNPTFKTHIESDFGKLLETISINSDSNFGIDCSIFSIGWNNYLIQHKEHMSFINKALIYLIDGIDTNDLCLYGSLVVLQKSKELEIKNKEYCDNIKLLRNEFLRKTIALVKKVEQNRVSWCINSIYAVIKNTTSNYDYKSLLLEFFDKESENSFTSTINDLIAGYQPSVIIDIFKLYSLICPAENYTIFFAHFLALTNSSGVDMPEDSFVEPLTDFIVSKLTSKPDIFIKAFKETAIDNLYPNNEYLGSILQIYQIFLAHLVKNAEIVGIFKKSISNLILITHNDASYSNTRKIIMIISNLKKLLNLSPWLFDQYCIEKLFPLCVKILTVTYDNALIHTSIEATTLLFSSVLNFHRYKLSNRHNLVNQIMCFYLEILSGKNNLWVNKTDAMCVSRLIMNYCEPNISFNSNNNNNGLNSKFTIIKNNLRRNLYPVLLTYIYLCVNKPWKDVVRQELIKAVYTVFDVLSHDELTMINANLDYSGKAYFKNLYEDYKVSGKWKDD